MSNESIVKISPKVLVVEDVPMVQMVHLAMFKELGCNVDLAENGQQALDLAKNKYDFIFMDIGLPDINGIEVARKIRHSIELKSSKSCIIAITAYVEDEIGQACIDVGIDAIETKPVKIKRLQQIIYKKGFKQSDTRKSFKESTYRRSDVG